MALASGNDSPSAAAPGARAKGQVGRLGAGAGIGRKLAARQPAARGAEVGDTAAWERR